MPVKLLPLVEPVAINGSPFDKDKPIPVRRELRDLKNNYSKEWTLFLIGLDDFKNKTPEDHPLSYFQIAGIHGRPFTNWPDKTTWNKIKQFSPDDTEQWQGFCTHTSILFLPWHRPYLALFEYELRRHAEAVAKEYTVEEGGPAYIEAAKTLRLPYWDWALPAGKDNGVFPIEALTKTEHNVPFPKSRGVKSFTTNPLAAYKFGSTGVQNPDIDFYSSHATVRWPLRGKTTTDEQGMRTKLLAFLENTDPRDKRFFNKGKNLTERVLYLLQSYSNFGSISHNLFREGQGFGNWGSLEDVHNSVHDYVGNGGHMGDPAIAAFDPIFWLHHANMDRLWAIWQAIWDKGGDDQFVKPQAAFQGPHGNGNQGGTFSNDWRANDTIDTPLTPFTKDSTGTIWTSKGVRSTATFGYVYPETKSSFTKEEIFQLLKSTYPNASLADNIKADKDKRAAVTEELQSRATALLTLQAAPLTTAELIQVAPAGESDAQQKLVDAAQQVEIPAQRSLADLVHDNKYLEWLVDLRAEKHALGGNFAVHVFLGDPDDADPSLYLADPNHVAAFSTFGTGEDTGCENCKKGQEAGLKVTGQIPLTLALVERYLAGKIDSITPDHVVEYLKTDLHWRVTDSKGARISRADVNALLVSVVSNEVTLPEGPTALPQYAPDVKVYPDVTTRADQNEGRGRGTGYTEGQL